MSGRSEARLLRWDAAIRRSAADLERAEAARQRAAAASQRAEAARIKADHLLEEMGSQNASGADERERIANEREVAADERDRVANEREAEADERDRVANHREAQADERERAATEEEEYAGEREDRLREWEMGVIEAESAAIRSANWREAHLDDRERTLRLEEAEFDERGRIAEQDELSHEMDRSARQVGRAVTDGGRLAGLVKRGATLRALAADLADRLAEEAEEFAAYMENVSERGDRERRLAIAETEREIARIERQNAAKLRDFDKTSDLVHHLPKLPDADSVPVSPVPGDGPGAGEGHDPGQTAI